HDGTVSISGNALDLLAYVVNALPARAVTTLLFLGADEVGRVHEDDVRLELLNGAVEVRRGLPEAARHHVKRREALGKLNELVEDFFSPACDLALADMVGIDAGRCAERASGNLGSRHFHCQEKDGSP